MYSCSDQCVSCHQAQRLDDDEEQRVSDSVERLPRCLYITVTSFWCFRRRHSNPGHAARCRAATRQAPPPATRVGSAICTRTDAARTDTRQDTTKIESRSQINRVTTDDRAVCADDDDDDASRRCDAVERGRCLETRSASACSACTYSCARRGSDRTASRRCRRRTSLYGVARRRRRIGTATSWCVTRP